MVAPTVDTIRVADEVWVATALLHVENPARADFSAKEIEARAEAEHLAPALRPGVYVHALQHCVANVPPSSGRYRMLYATARGRRRLWRPGDDFHPQRASGKTAPARQALPAPYQHLLDWYEDWAGANAREDPLLALAGSGRDTWRGESGDDYVRRLREGWE